MQRVNHVPQTTSRPDYFSSLLEDLIETQGSKGKWFAAAKTAKYLDIALDCAAQPDAAPATLIGAARDFVIKEPAFAAQVVARVDARIQRLAHLAGTQARAVLAPRSLWIGP